MLLALVVALFSALRYASPKRMSLSGGPLGSIKRAATEQRLLWL